MTAGGVLRGTLRLLWHAFRLPVFVFLAILEPIVRFILGALALLGVLTALFFKVYGVPHFPSHARDVGRVRIDAGGLLRAATAVRQVGEASTVFRRRVLAHGH
jgi:hypothetical protein